mmetsp:Transcript_41238/g.53205  ORF Transcript_41238/g.53205 Transcript_41238/m.53205 type:complete len:192 (+) Transcript_41238:507-1082(+)|eukprot:CAMPEP_0114343680 /NCGR_PEP_ID=MMETSP0101-20121206/10805_1 /TAXON_ID=38822 ORGANISM="Pteridomonas danica, Strain PT" /NCGR_SAMPLE_ID=MMETSP0101 /ASSEMBLY_ACC=CAM_ASM_000211 /LENGTH=191 /DNA_ID=CAMNT_0001478557 /DNA_START=382 /DNA_END=957 /DNA_ORIENTATION=+
MKCWSSKKQIPKSDYCIRCIHCEENLEPEDAMTHWCNPSPHPEWFEMNNETDKNLSSNNDNGHNDYSKSVSHPKLTHKENNSFDYSILPDPSNNTDNLLFNSENIDPWTALARDQYLISAPTPSALLNDPPQTTSQKENILTFPEPDNSSIVESKSISAPIESTSVMAQNENTRRESIDNAMFYSSFGPPP